MKGSFKTVNVFDHLHSKTNFNDWSDPKCKSFKPVKTSVAKEKQDILESPKADAISVISQTELEIEQLRQKLKDGYPLMSRKEIRNVKLPYYKSLLLNLEEDGFLITCEYVKDLIVLDQGWHKQIRKDRSVNNRPFLKSSIATLNLLCNSLTKAELERREGNKNQELRYLLDLAIQLSRSDNECWHWLAEEIFQQGMSTFYDRENFTFDQRLEAVAKHIYATFLLDILHDTKRSKLHVEESMELSVGKFWNASEVTGKQHDILYLESCLLLHKIFLQMAHEKRGYDIEGAIELCRKSLHWAKQISCKVAEATVLLNLIHIYIDSNQLSPVLEHLENYMKLCNELNDVKGLCEGYILKATYNEIVGESDLVIKNLQKLLEISEESNLTKIIALAHRKLATFYLIHSNDKEMQIHATKAYSYYVKLNSTSEMEETRCLTGIAQAQEIMTQYIDILLSSENIDFTEFSILMFWKSLRIPFFTTVKLLQPEGEINSQIKDRMEKMKIEEFLAISEMKRAEIELSRSIAQQRTLTKHFAFSASKQSGSQPTQSVLNFHRHMRMLCQIMLTPNQICTNL